MINQLMTVIVLTVPKSVVNLSKNLKKFFFIAILKNKYYSYYRKEVGNVEG